VSKTRLDQLLVEREFFATRSRAADAIKRGHVSINGIAVEKPGQRVDAASQLTVSDPAAAYVSRAALKLLSALDHFELDVAGTIAADIGASTGGFSQILLERGAQRIYAVDVGHDQLDISLRNEARIISMEGLNARNITKNHIPEPLDLIVSDVSFISLKLALPQVLNLARPQARLIALIKPQFEVGRKNLGKGGIVRDDDLRQSVVEDIKNWLMKDMKWEISGLIPSPVSGSDGNKEFLIHAIKS
jgi:23S rRNA (cytidine1920-2'-O)/16S rRNA (cytidine1409-2'-O)-methyltransferase